MTYTECGGWGKGRRVGFALVSERFQRAADHGLAAVNRLEDVEIKLFAARHADVETVALDRLVNALRVNRENFLRTLKRRIVQRRAVDRAEDRFLFLGERARRARQK